MIEAAFIPIGGWTPCVGNILAILFLLDVIATITANIRNHGNGVVSRTNIFFNSNYPPASCLHCPNRILINKFGICQVEHILLRVRKCNTQIFREDHSTV